MLEEQVQSLISRIEKCVRGDRFEAQLTEVPVKVVIHVFWEEDLEATTLYEVDFTEMNDKETALLDFLVRSYELDVCPIFDNGYINELPSFADTKIKIDAFHKEVNDILIELTELSKKHPETFDSIKSIVPASTEPDEN